MLYGNTAMSDSAWAGSHAPFPPCYKVHSVEISSTLKGREKTWLKKIYAFVAGLVMLMWKVNTIRKKTVSGTNSIARNLNQCLYDSVHSTHLKL